jgi:hypothetical protein
MCGGGLDVGVDQATKDLVIPRFLAAAAVMTDYEPFADKSHQIIGARK